jgi:hypothetical protein
LNKKIQASFTVEAVMVMPVVLFSIVFIIYLSFYLYDYCRIQGITDLLLHKATLNLKHEADIGSGVIFYEEIGRQGVFYQSLGISDSKIHNIECRLKEKLSKGLLVTKITDVNISADIYNISACVEGEFKIPVKGVANMLFKKRTVKVEAKRELHDPAQIVRISEVVLDLGSKIKGLNELKENLKALQGQP